MGRPGKIEATEMVLMTSGSFEIRKFGYVELLCGICAQFNAGERETIVRKPH